ncbi:MAG: hypothetical protein ABI082_01800 [Dokdonella sp.]
MVTQVDVERLGLPSAATGQSGHESGVSWGAIIAGAAGAAALSYILVILGFGLGLSAISPWTGSGVEAKTIGVATIVWLAFTQIAAAGMGGYLAGRLRVRWVNLHTDEVYFRDTAHGFLSWAVASLVVAAFLGSAVASALSGGASIAGSALQGAASATTSALGKMSGDGDVAGYFVDTLFRRQSSATATNSESDGKVQAEAARIIIKDVQTGSLSAPDKQYLAQLVAARTGLSQDEAVQRVDSTFTAFQHSIDSAKDTAKKAADDARKASAYAALWFFVALLIGAFCASLAATLGGRRRDMFPSSSTRVP